MNTPEETIDYFRTDFDLVEQELAEMSELDNLRIEINDGLEEALSEMQRLREQISEAESAKLIELCKNTVVETITAQFGLTDLFVEVRDGGNVTTTHNFEKGITATDADQKKYEEYVANNNGSIKWEEVKKKYDAPLPQKRKDAFKNQEIIIDAYTGKQLPKNGQAHLDHIVSVKEIESNARFNLHMDPEKRVKMATNDKNLAFTESRANQSKGEHEMKDWLSKKNSNTGQTNAERFDIDTIRAQKKDSESRRYIKKEITVACAKKYGSELLKTGGKDAAKMAAYSSLGLVLRDLVQAIFVEIHVTLRERGKESFSEIFCRFKNSLTKKLAEIIGKWKELLCSGIEGGLTAFFSNMLIFVINLVATTLKKIVTMIRAGFVSLAQAIKIMVNPPEGMPKEEVGYQAVKILITGLIGAVSLGLSAAIEKLLQSIPGLQPLMMFPVPFPGKTPRTVSDILATVLSALVGGLLSTIVLYFIDKYREGSRKEKLYIQLVNQSGAVVQYKIAQTWMCLDEAYRWLQNSAVDFAYYLSDGQNTIRESGVRADQALAKLSDSKQRLKEVFKKI